MLYRIGSVLSLDDLYRYSAHKASAIFFLCDNGCSKLKATSDDMETALQVLAIESYNLNLELLTQVNLLKNRNLMYDNEVDVVLTLDDFKVIIFVYIFRRYYIIYSILRLFVDEIINI